MRHSSQNTTQAHHAYEPPHDGVRRRWRMVIAGLLLTALTCLTLRPVCQPDVAGAGEYGFWIRHEQRGTTWYHCEPWIRRALAK
jgi:hypothetical protein